MPLKLIEEWYSFEVVGCLQGRHKFVLWPYGYVSDFNNNVYYAAVENIHTASKAIFHTLCRKAVKEEKEMNSQKGKPLQNLIVFGDGT